MTGVGEHPPGTPRPAVVLVGFMGAGKSTVGRMLAKHLGVGFVDTDAEIEQRAGHSIPHIFASGGEAEFRALEAEVIADVLAEHSGVVALGGGAVTSPAVREALTGHTVAYLEIDADAGFARVAKSDRPLLAEADPAAAYRRLLAGRLPVYESVATVTVGAHQTPEQVVDDLLAHLNDEGA